MTLVFMRPPSAVIRMIGTIVPGLMGLVIPTNMRWLPPGLSSSMPFAGRTKPPAFCCMTIAPSLATTSWSWTAVA